jgi:putative membrane protein
MKARFVALVLALTLGAAHAQLARSDRRFIAAAAESGMFEVQIAQLAAAKATDPAVKGFAGMLVDQHTAANDALARIAAARRVDLPPAPGRGLRREIDRIAKNEGDAFDRAFVRTIGIEAHEQDIRRFEKASRDVHDADLKAWVATTLPMLRAHLAAAEKLHPSDGNAATIGVHKR